MARRYSTGDGFERQLSSDPYSHSSEQWSSPSSRPGLNRAFSVTYLYTPKTMRGLGAVYVFKDRCRHAKGHVYRSSAKLGHAIGKSYTCKSGSSITTEDEWKRAEERRLKRNSVIKDELDHAELSKLSAQMASKEYIAEMRKRNKELVDEVNSSQAVPVVNKDRHVRSAIEDDISDEDMTALSKSLRASAKRRPMMFGVSVHSDQSDCSIRDDIDETFPDFRMSVYKSELVRGNIKSLDEDLEDNLLSAAKDVMPGEAFAVPLELIDSENSETMQVLRNAEQVDEESSNDIVAILEKDTQFSSTSVDRMTHEDMSNLSRSLQNSVKRRPMVFGVSAHSEQKDGITSSNHGDGEDDFPAFRMSVYKSELVRGSIQAQGDDLENDLLSSAKDRVQDGTFAAHWHPTDVNNHREGIPMPPREMEALSSTKDQTNDFIQFEDIPANHSFLIPTSYHAGDSSDPVELIPLSLFEPMLDKHDSLNMTEINPLGHIEHTEKTSNTTGIPNQGTDLQSSVAASRESPNSDKINKAREISDSINVRQGSNLDNKNTPSKPGMGGYAYSDSHNYRGDNVYDCGEELDSATSDSDIVKLLDTKDNTVRSDSHNIAAGGISREANSQMGFKTARHVPDTSGSVIGQSVDAYYENSDAFSRTHSNITYTITDKSVNGNDEIEETVLDNTSAADQSTSSDTLDQTFDSVVSDSAPLLRSSVVGRSSIGMAGLYGSSKTFILPNSIEALELNVLQEDAETTQSSEMDSFSSDTPLVPSSKHSINRESDALSELGTLYADVTDSTLSLNETNELNVSVLI